MMREVDAWRIGLRRTARASGSRSCRSPESSSVWSTGGKPRWKRCPAPATAFNCAWPLLALIVLSAVLVCGSMGGCGGRHSYKGDGEGGYESNRSMPLREAEDILQSAQQARMEGRYERATEWFLTIYQEQDADESLRSHALYGLAEVYATLANPAKDLNRAIGLFERILVEFPHSALGAKVERRIVEIRALLGAQGDG